MTTWNPSDKAAQITLSNGNLTATSSANSGPTVRSTTSKSAGKLKIEFVVGAIGTAGARVGLTTAGAALSSQVGIAASTLGWVSSGIFQTGGITAGSGVTFTTGDVLGFELDFTTNKLYVSKNGVYAFGTNPATAAAFALPAATPMFAAASPNISTLLTANFGASAFSYAPYTGFSSWDPPVSALAADGAAFTQTGVAAGLRATRRLSADGGAFVVEGVDPALNKSRIMTADAGSYATSGVSASILATRGLAAGPASIVYTGNVAVLQAAHNFLLDALAGTVGISGQSASFRRTYQLSADAGAYNVYGALADVRQSQSRILTALGGETLFRALLVTMEFTSETMRVWQGEGRLDTGVDGIFLGMGRFGSISAVEQPVSGAAPQISLSLSGVDEEIVAMALDAEAEVKGRPVTIAIGVWDPVTREYLGKLTPLRGVMDRMVYSCSVEYDDESSRITRLHNIQVTVESVLASRRILPSQATYSAADQSLRHPSDRGLDFAGTLGYKSYHWPIFA